MIVGHTYPFNTVNKPPKSILEEAYETQCKEEYGAIYKGSYESPIDLTGKRISKDTTGDSNVDSVINKYCDRAAVGFGKYKVTTDRTDISFVGWLTHLQEELMDAVIYIERTKKELQG